MFLLYLAAWLTFAHKILLRYLTCLKRRPRLRLAPLLYKNQVWPLISAHRGGSYEYIENTLHAFTHAILLGSNFLECDVHLTLDEQVVICHDENLDRLCDDDVEIATLKYDELPLFAKYIPMHFSYDKMYKRKPEEEGARFAKLEDLFNLA